MGKGLSSTFAWSWCETMTTCVEVRDKLKNDGNLEPGYIMRL